MSTELHNKENLLNTANHSLLSIIDRPEIVMESGQGMFMQDTEGNEYLDFIGGWAVNCLGHSPKVVAQVLAEQGLKLINSSPAFYNKPMLEYAHLLVNNSCLDRVFFTSTGAEANEGAIKLARKYGLSQKNGATEIITTHNSFHGRTLVTMAATGKAHWETLYGPKLPGFKKAEFNNLDSIKALIDENTCAVMLEPIQGEAGVNVASKEFMQGLRKLCDENEVLLILDEVQTGMGRTGKLFAYELYDIEPDIMTLGKGIGAGFPLSAMLAKESLNIFEPGDQGGTYTAQPLAMAVGKVVLQNILSPGFLSHCEHMGEYIRTQLKQLSETYEIVNIRGNGLLIAFDLLHSNGSRVVNKCLEMGVIINSPRENVIRLIPPLIVEENDVDQMLDVLCQNLKQRIDKKL